MVPNASGGQLYPTADKVGKDNNFRGVGIFGGNLYVSKGSGSNGDNGIFQVLNGSAQGLPTGGTNNAIVEILGNPSTDPVTNAPAPKRVTSINSSRTSPSFRKTSPRKSIPTGSRPKYSKGNWPPSNGTRY